MDPRSKPVTVSDPVRNLSRRATVRRLIIGGGAAALAGRSLAPVAAQEATPAAGACVATAPPAQDGVGFASLLVGGIVPDMPAGPVDVRLSRFTLDPGASIPSATLPYPSMAYVETGELTCPDNPGKIMYGPDGAVMYETTGGAEWHTCTPGMTWYVPAGIADAAANEGNTLMSALFFEFVPVEESATPTM
jgi:quercetin dioxygenase-like cupin family protein